MAAKPSRKLAAYVEKHAPRRAASSATAGVDAVASAAMVPPNHSTSAVQRAREWLYARPGIWELGARILREFDLSPETQVDMPRLRVITAGDEALPVAAPIYVNHRDTWYACPQDQVNWWLPVFDCPESQAFAFYPDFFRRAVPNASGAFTYGRWVEEVGWHGEAPLEAYPQPLAGVDPGRILRFELAAGELLLFASAHLHQTTPNPHPGSARWSPAR